ncbi:hypothetical protein ACFYPZ_21155 [Streptomyces sp. NPDC005506]|uniref:hypothetical protein n=1 Tax=unclassified Streptomyces TaxID=2593676 RepID=UPI0036935E58
MLAQITVLGSEILPGDVLALKPSSHVEEIGSVQGLSISLHLEDAGIYIVWAARRYLVTREIADGKRPAGSVLVLGPTASADDVMDLRAYAADVAEELGVPATFATHNDYGVTDFSAVYVRCAATELHDTVGLVLVAEALAAGMPVHEPQSPRDAAPCVCGQVQTVRTVIGEDGDVWCAECRGEIGRCNHCSESMECDKVENVEEGSTWWPVHASCLAEARRVRPDVEYVTA